MDQLQADRTHPLPVRAMSTTPKLKRNKMANTAERHRADDEPEIQMTMGSLFSGLCDGFGLAAQWAGMEVVWQVEIKKKAHGYLDMNFPKTEKHYDIHGVGGHNLAPVDIICGGDPCQPHSVAGKRRGPADDRFLWPEMLRVVRELGPHWVINENVAGSISNMVLDRKITDLEAEGYTTRAFVVPAVSIGAPHRRDRVWLVAHSDRRHGGKGPLSHPNDSDSQKQREPVKVPEADPCPGRYNRWTAEPQMDRMAHGLPDRVAQLEGLGDAVVPGVAHVLLDRIATIERIFF